MLKVAAILLLGISTFRVIAQEPEYPDLVKAENRLQSLFNGLYGDTLQDPEPILDTIAIVMPEVLSKDGAMEYPWKGLDRIGVITSDDGRIRIFTWHVTEDPDNYCYYGYIQVAQRKGRIDVVKLVDNQQNQRNLQKLDQSVDDWYGKLYYRIITNRYRRKTYYTLLGMDFNDSRSIFKTIEVLVINRNNPQFEKELFFNGKERMDRLVLEYSTQVAMSLRYDPDMKMITFDHLVPFHPIYNGNYEFYGPDGSFDGLEFASGIWILREDIDARNQY
jgi:hypothetical protein